MDPREPIRARVTLRVHEGEIVASVSDGEGGISIHRESDAPQPSDTGDGEISSPQGSQTPRRKNP